MTLAFVRSIQADGVPRKKLAMAIHTSLVVVVVVVVVVVLYWELYLRNL